MIRSTGITMSTIRYQAVRDPADAEAGGVEALPAQAGDVEWLTPAGLMGIGRDEVRPATVGTETVEQVLLRKLGLVPAAAAAAVVRPARRTAAPQGQPAAKAADPGRAIRELVARLPRVQDGGGRDRYPRVLAVEIASGLFKRSARLEYDLVAERPALPTFQPVDVPPRRRTEWVEGDRNGVAGVYTFRCRLDAPVDQTVAEFARFHQDATSVAAAVLDA